MTIYIFHIYALWYTCCIIVISCSSVEAMMVFLHILALAISSSYISPLPWGFLWYLESHRSKFLQGKFPFALSKCMGLLCGNKTTISLPRPWEGAHFAGYCPLSPAQITIKCSVSLFFLGTKSSISPGLD